MNKKLVLKEEIKPDEFERKVEWEPLEFNLSSGTWKGWTYSKEGDKDDK